MFQYYKWEELDINWEGVDMNWEEVGFLINEVGSIVGPGFVSGKHVKENDYLTLKQLNKLPEEKKRKIIKIVFKLTKDDEYISYKYKNEDIKITADHINIIIDEISKNKIKVNVQNIS